MEIVDVDRLDDTVGIHIHPRGNVFGVNQEFISFSTGYKSSSLHAKTIGFTDVDNVRQTVETTSATPSTVAYYQHTYTLEIYDYLQQTGSDSVSRATWQWKLKEDGTTLFESHDGTSQIEPRFAAAPPSVSSGGWCSDPKIRITHNGFGSFSNSMEFDNLKLTVNGDDSCVTTAPPV